MLVCECTCESSWFQSVILSIFVTARRIPTFGVIVILLVKWDCPTNIVLQGFACVLSLLLSGGMTVQSRSLRAQEFATNISHTLPCVVFGFGVSIFLVFADRVVDLDA